jgi:hypothetical protein
MSSTNKTANYKLSQWLPGDALSHEDVNADNAKIDAAIKSAADATAAHEPQPSPQRRTAKYRLAPIPARVHSTPIPKTR